MAYQMAAMAVTVKVIHRLHAFSNAICRTFVQHFTWCQLTVCAHGSSALAELLVQFGVGRQTDKNHKTLCSLTSFCHSLFLIVLVNFLKSCNRKRHIGRLHFLD